ncbi:MAG: general stress protein [Phenylobacterium sp.]|nr:general stress protein [Phenylobacterium sp.]
MSRTVTRLFNTHTEAMAAVTDLEAAGFRHDDISIIASNADNWHGGHKHPTRDVDGENDTAEGAGKGAATGGLIGAGGGLLAGLGMLAIPGLGPVVAAGWLASTAVGAIAGAAVGGATGGILGALKDAGHSDEEAQVYAEGVRRGGTLVSVKADDSRAMEADSILSGRTGVQAMERGAAYREQGWRGYDADAPVYSADEVARERARYVSGENRTFGGIDPEEGRRERDPLTGAPRTEPPLGRSL